MFDNIEKIENEPMKKHTTLHIGGNARWFLMPKDDDELLSIMFECKECGVDFFILGGGSNLLVSDDGFGGAVVSMSQYKSMNLIGDDCVEVGAGVSLFELNVFCQKNDLSGLEFSYGIPGSVGGACKMNAGAYGGEFCKYVKSVKVFDGVKIKTRTKLTYAYRKGCLRKNEILLSAVLQLKKGSGDDIKQKQMEYLLQRKNSQPYGEFSLGSVFKRGTVIPAKFIDDLGLKGLSCGDVQISTKHAGFIVNNGGGTAKDFLKLVYFIENEAQKRGAKFEREFCFLE